MSGRTRSIGVTSLSLALLLGVWQLLAILSGPDALSGPWQTAKALRSAARDGYLWSDLGITSSRLVIAFALGFAASFVLGFALGLSDRLARVFGVWITVLASVPALVYIVACYLVIGISNTAAVIAVAIVVMPNATSAISDGVRATDPGLREMGRTFGAGRRHLLWHVIVPQATPWIFTAARSCWSLTWRIMVFAELLGRPNGVGYRIQYWFNLADMPRVTAAALPLVVLIVLVDVGLFRAWERRLARWRPVELR